MVPRIAYILPTYTKLDYSARCLASLEEASAGAHVRAFVLDDGSPNWHTGWLKKSRIVAHAESDTRQGLTHVWNRGFALARQGNFDFIVAGNDDVLFPRGWWVPFLRLACSNCIAGPLSNAPGTTNPKVQQISTWISYKLSDDAQDITRTLRNLEVAQFTKTVPGPINGFFMWGSKPSWDSLAHNSDYQFPKSIDTMPSGRSNPTPHMTGQEDWLYTRCNRLGVPMITILSAFIWHYRSVSRGAAFRTSGSFRVGEKVC